MGASNRSIVKGIACILVCMTAAPLATPIAQAEVSLAQITGPKPTVDLTMDDKHVIKEFTLDAPDVPKKTGQAELTIGAKLPADFPLQPFPEEAAKKVPEIKAHQFFAQDNKIFVVDPTRTIAEIIPRDKR